MLWGTAIGAWGDTLAAIGNAMQMLKARGQKRCGILHYGADSRIAELLVEQDCFAEVIHVTATGYQRYMEVVSQACWQDSPGREWLEFLLRETGIEARQVVDTHVSAHLQRESRIYRFRDAALPESSRSWAAATLYELTPERKVYLLNPYSIQSNGLAVHWPLWREAIDWLARCTPHLYLLVGQSFEGRPQFQPLGERVKDLIGKTPSMMEVFALADLCDGVITTSNGLSMWTVVQGKPAVVCTTHMVPYYYNWINVAPNRLVLPHQPLEDFIAAFRAIERERMT